MSESTTVEDFAEHAASLHLMTTRSSLVQSWYAKTGKPSLPATVALRVEQAFAMSVVEVFPALQSAFPQAVNSKSPL